MHDVCKDSYFTTFGSYVQMLDYHRDQSAKSRWQRCRVSDLEVAPLDRGSSLAGKLGLFAPGISQEAVDDTADNLGLAMMVDHQYYPVRGTAYKSLLDRAKIGGTALPKLSRTALADVLNACLRLYAFCGGKDAGGDCQADGMFPAERVQTAFPGTEKVKADAGEGWCG